MLRYRPSCVGRKFAISRSTIFNPCACRSRSRMTFGFSNETVYDATELRKPGWNSSVTAAPPTTPRRSSTVTPRPAAARYAAQTRPLWPPPMISASRKFEFLGGCHWSWFASHAPAPGRSPMQTRLGNQRAHAPAEASQAYFAVTQWPDGIAAGSHACLHALDQRFVFDADTAIDPPVE